MSGSDEQDEETPPDGCSESSRSKRRTVTEGTASEFVMRPAFTDGGLFRGRRSSDVFGLRSDTVRRMRKSTDRQLRAIKSSLPSVFDELLGPETPALRRRNSDSNLSLMVGQHMPQALPCAQIGDDAPDELLMRASSIENKVKVAKRISDEEGAPVLTVGEWVFHEDLKVLYDGTSSSSLTNSIVKMGSAKNVAKESSPQSATDESDTSEVKVAVKTVSLESDAESIAMLRREIDILRALGDMHPHILPLLHSVENDHELVILTPYASAGDLCGYMPKNTPIPELQVKLLVLQLLSGLAHVHHRSIIHGDVKPQNVFLVDESGRMLAKLSDFGLSLRVPDGQEFVKLNGVQGSYGYIPREVIQSGEVYFSSDLFALGVMCFTYLGAHEPFYPPSKVTEPIEFDDSTWSYVSSRGRDFSVQLLGTDPTARGKAQGLMDEHPWFLPEVAEGEGSGAPLMSFESEMVTVNFLDLDAAHRVWTRDYVAASP